MVRPIAARNLLREICDNLKLEHVRRIIIDLNYDSVGLLYVEMIADERMYEIDFKNNLKIEPTTRQYLPGQDGELVDVTTA